MIMMISSISFSTRMTVTEWDAECLQLESAHCQLAEARLQLEKMKF